MSSSPSLPAWPSSADELGAKESSLSPPPPPPGRESPDANKRGGGNNGNNGSGKADKKWTWKKPKGKPKRPLSAYNIFFRHERERMLVEEEAARAIAPPPEDDGGLGLGRKRGRKSNPKVGFTDLAKHIAERWADLDEPSRSSFEELAAEDKRRYLSQLRRWEMEQDALGIPIKRRRGRKAAAAGGGARAHQATSSAVFHANKRANSRRLSSDSVDSLDVASVDMSVASAPSHMQRSQYSLQQQQGQQQGQQHRRSVDSWDLDCCVEQSLMEQSSKMEPLPVDAVPSSLPPYVEDSVNFRDSVSFPANNNNANAFGNGSASSIGSVDGVSLSRMSFDAATMSERVRSNFAKLQKIYGGGGSSEAAGGGVTQQSQMSPPPGLLSNWSSSSISMPDTMTDSPAHIQSSGGTLDSDDYMANQTKSEELQYEELGYHDPYSSQAQAQAESSHCDDPYSLQQESSHHDDPYSQGAYHRARSEPLPDANDQIQQQQQRHEQVQHQSQESFLSDDELQFLTSGPSISSGISSANANTSSSFLSSANANNASSFSGGGDVDLPNAMEGGAGDLPKSEGEINDHHHSSLQLDDATVDFLMRSVHAVEEDYNSNNNAAGSSKQQKSGGGNGNDCSMANVNANGASMSNMGLSLSDLTGGAPLQQNPFTPHMA